jgi:AraC family transcriptional regulator of arabinose operon
VKGIKHFFSEPPVRSPALTIRGMGLAERMKPCLIDRPGGSGDFLLMFFHGNAEVGTTRHESAFFGEPCFVVWTPGHRQYYGNRTDGFVHSWLHCEGVLPARLLRSCRIPRNRVIRFSRPGLLERHFAGLYEELISPVPEARIAANLLENLLADFARCSSAGAGAVPPEGLLRARRTIEQDYGNKLRLPGLARIAGYSPSHFSALFRRHFGLAPVEFLLRHRMHRAAYLLQDRNRTVGEIAGQVGYADLFQFSKLFKKYFGRSPRAFRVVPGR